MKLCVMNCVLCFKILLVFFCIINLSCGRGFQENFYPNSYYETQQATVRAALEKLNHAPQLDTTWPNSTIKFGQVSGVALTADNQVLVFHRASNTWDASTFSDRHVYQQIGEPPIPHPTVLLLNDTGELVDMWGENLFYMPHGITSDAGGNVWLTDVALHQVFKFTPEQRKKPALVLGEKFVPGDDDFHFCKPSAVAVLPDGDFFVADGYCNSRVVKFAPDGTKILQWGRRYGDSPFVLNVPHALTLAPARGLLCVADRERGRAVCFRADSGALVASYSSWLIGGRLFSVAYSDAHGGRLYIVNGPSGGVPVRGYIIDFDSGKLVGTFAPGESFSNPHDIVVTPDGSRVYVAELNPYRVYKFTDDSLVANESVTVAANVTVPVKPTATVEFPPSAVAPPPGSRLAAWGGAALGGAGAALLAAAALALLRAKDKGRGAEGQPFIQ